MVTMPTDAERGRFRARVADLIGVRRTPAGAWTINGKRFRTRTLAVCYVNGFLFEVLIPGYKRK